MGKGNIYIIYDIKQDMYGKKVDILIKDINQDMYEKLIHDI